MLTDDVIARIQAQVPDFDSRVEGAGELAVLTRGGHVPNRTPAAFVIPLGLSAQPPKDATGVHHQPTAETIGVVIVVTVANDARGAKAMPKVETLRDAVISALAGWTPASSTFAPFELTRARLMSLNNGTITYQVDFKINSYLRITP